MKCHIVYLDKKWKQHSTTVSVDTLTEARAMFKHLPILKCVKCYERTGKMKTGRFAPRGYIND